jgi:uncharacterized protein
MKRFLITIIAALLTFNALGQQTQPVAPPPGPALETVTVSGVGRASTTPDRFTFSVGVQTVAATVDDAVAENNRKVAAVIAALKAAGATDKDIQTSQFNIWPQQNYEEGKLPRIVGYQVSNEVRVRSEKIADAGKLLGVALGAGVNTSSGLQFEVSDPARGREQGLKAAFDDARAKASLLAQAAGRTLGRAVMISEGVQHGGTPPPMPMQRSMVAEGRIAGDVPVESGSQELTFTITATFELR